MSTQRVLLRGGMVLSMDPQIGTLANGDVLIEEDRILAIAPGLPDDDAELVDVSGHILAPGMIDTHRHTWQTQLRGLCADWTLTDYVFGVRLTLSPAYRPEDVYLGNRTGALDALNAGVTTLLDFSHCNNTPEHADAAVTGLRDSGIRAVFGYGFFESSPFAPPHFAAHADRLADFARVADQWFTSKDNLITLGVALTEPELVPLAVTQEEVLAAREREALIVTHTGCLWQFPTAITAMDEAGLLGPDQVHVHCNTLTDDEWRRLARNDAKLSISPETELNMGMGRPAFAAAARHGIKPTLSCDVLSLNTGDLFTQLRLGVAFQRWADTEPVNLAGGDPEAVTITAHDALQWTTVNAAEAVGLDDRIGSLTPGKQADVLVVANPANSHPQIDPAGTLLFQTTADSVRHVLVAGRFVKRDGKLVGVDANQLNAQAAASAHQILTGIADNGRRLPGTLPGGLAIIKELVD